MQPVRTASEHTGARRLLPCLLSLLLWQLPAAGSAQTVRGTVVEDGPRTPIRGASVELLRGADAAALGTVTDSSGAFVLRATRAGTYRVRLTHPSYATMTSDTLAIGPGESLVVELRMGRQAIPLEPLVVTAQGNARHGGFYQRQRQPGLGRFITRTDIDARPGAYQTTELLRGIPGVEIVPVRRGRGGAVTNMIMTRGGMGRCEPVVVLDGTPIRQFPDSGIDDFLKVDMIEGVEIYTSTAGAPPQFMTANNACGVVAFWTRTGGSDGEKLTLKRLLMAVGVAAGLVLLILLGN